MRAEWCETGPSTSITLDIRSDTKMSPQNPMNISAILNPKAEDEDVEMEDRPRSICYDLPLHYRAEPVEPGANYGHGYPTPANSPAHQYSTMSNQIRFQQPPCGPLPPMNVPYQDYPSPPPTFAEYHSMQPVTTQLTVQMIHTQSFNHAEVIRSHRPRQLDAQSIHRRPSYPSTISHVQAGQGSQLACSRRSSRSERDYLHRRASAPTSPTNTSKPCYLDLTPQTALPPPQKKAKRTPSNEAYKREEVHWMRYTRIDMALKWPVIVDKYPIQFPSGRAVGSGGIGSRFYRDNYLPRIDVHGNIMYDLASRVMTFEMKVRSKNSEEYKDVPWTFAERHPWAALEYDWISAEHKKVAAKIVADIEKTDPSQYTRKQQYAVAIREYERTKDSLRQTRRNGSLSEASGSPGADDDLSGIVAIPTAEEILQMEEDEKEMDKLYKEAAKLKCS